MTSPCLLSIVFSPSRCPCTLCQCKHSTVVLLPCPPPSRLTSTSPTSTTTPLFLFLLIPQLSYRYMPLLVCVCTLKVFVCFPAASVFFSLSLQLNQAAGTDLLKLSVSDKDSPRNGAPFVFRIASGNEGSYFALDQTGTLKANRLFGSEAPREFTLEIQVKDVIYLVIYLRILFY